jgi:hypothetical protein
MRGKAKTSRRAEAKTTLRARGDRLKLSLEELAKASRKYSREPTKQDHTLAQGIVNVAGKTGATKMRAARCQARKRIVARDVWDSKDFATSRGQTTIIARDG